jgi:hypothetical protein
MTGIRSCTGATSSFAVVVMIVQLSTSSPLARSVQAVHKPANANGSSSSRLKRIGCLRPSLPARHS